MTPARLRQLRRTVERATRGKTVHLVPTVKPPTILMLGLEDYAHAKAVCAFIQAFDSKGVTELLDEIGAGQRKRR